MRLASIDLEKPDNQKPDGDLATAEDAVVAAVRQALTCSTLARSPENTGRYLVAVSGGTDSMALLHAVSTLKDELSLSLFAAHVNHKARPDSDLDQACVAELCSKLKVPLSVTALPPCPAGENFEGWARAERYRFFSSCMAEDQLSTVLVAHHADDQLETFLMRLLSNKEPSAIQEVNPAFNIFRPLLSVTKQQIESYVETCHVPYCEDSSNADTKYLRNHVRHSLVPFMKEEFGEVGIAALKNQAKEIDDRYRALEDVAERYTSEYFTELTFGTRLWLDKINWCLNNHPIPVAELVLRRLFRPMHENPLGNSALRQLRLFFQEGRVAVQLPGRLEVRRRRGGIAVSSLIDTVRERK